MDDGRISEISGIGSSKNVKWRYSCGDRSRSTAGSGLGLSIVQAIAILNGGKIEVQNATDERGDACVCFAVEIYGGLKIPPLQAIRSFVDVRILRISG